MSTNNNHAQSINWMAIMSGRDDFVLRLKGVTIPSITVGTTLIATGSETDLSVPGDHIIYDDLSLDFYIDSDFNNYFEMLAWIKRNANNANDFSDVAIYILDHKGGVNYNRGFLFKDAYPFSLAGVLLDTENGDPNMFTNVVLKFAEFDTITKD